MELKAKAAPVKYPWRGSAASVQPQLVEAPSASPPTDASRGPRPPSIPPPPSVVQQQNAQHVSFGPHPISKASSSSGPSAVPVDVREDKSKKFKASSSAASQQEVWALHADVKDKLEQKAFEANMEHRDAELVALRTRESAEQEAALAAHMESKTELFKAETESFHEESYSLQTQADAARCEHDLMRTQLHATQKSMWDERAAFAEYEQQERSIESEAEQCMDREAQTQRLIMEKTEIVAELKLKMRNFTGSDPTADEETLRKLKMEVQQQRVLMQRSEQRRSDVRGELRACMEVRSALKAEQDVEDEALQSYLANALL